MRSIAKAIFIFILGGLGGDAAAPSKRTLSPTTKLSAKLYTFVCNAHSPEMCLAIPSGTVVATAPLGMVLKSYVRNQDKGADGPKMRFDVAFANSTIGYSLNAAMCVQRTGTGGSSAKLPAVKVAPCFAPLNLWDLRAFEADIAWAGGLSPLASSPQQCVTVMRCNPRHARDKAGVPFTFCDPTPANPMPAVPPFSTGSIVWMQPCSAAFAPAQTWGMSQDCAPGCNPFMQRDKLPCHQECNVSACNFQNYECDPTFSPSGAPSRSPSSSPITLAPTFAPTTLAPSANPSAAPTTSGPSRAPTRSPTNTRPSAAPTATSPTFAPSTTTPSSAPTQSPATSTPSSAPSRSPTRPAAQSPVWWWWILLLLLLLLLLCCCCCFVVGRRRRRAESESPHEEKETPVTPEVEVEAIDPELDAIDKLRNAPTVPERKNPPRPKTPEPEPDVETPPPPPPPPKPQPPPKKFEHPAYASKKRLAAELEQMAEIASAGGVRTARQGESGAMHHLLHDVKRRGSSAPVVHVNKSKFADTVAEIETREAERRKRLEVEIGAMSVARLKQALLDAGITPTQISMFREKSELREKLASVRDAESRTAGLRGGWIVGGGGEAKEKATVQVTEAELAG